MMESKCLIVTVAILCGGQGRRLGYRDKASLVFRGTRLIDRISELVKCISDDVFWVEKVPGQIKSLPHQVYARIHDHPIGGASGGVIAALRHASIQSHQNEEDHRSWCLVLSCDLPLITEVEILALADQASKAPPHLSCITFSEGPHPQPLCGIWRPATHGPLLAHIQAGGRLSSFVREYGTLLPIEQSSEQTHGHEALSPLFNLNTLEDLERLDRFEQRYASSQRS